MSVFDDAVILHHTCPVCHYETDEVYKKYLPETKPIFFNQQFIKELNGKKQFDRIRHNRKSYLTCPQCGVVLSCDVCETQTDYK